MAFLFSFLDALLSVILCIDTLTVIYQLRKTDKCDTKDYTRICFAWILFFFLQSIFTLGGKGWFWNTLAFIGLVAKILVVIPKTGITQMVYDKLIKEKKLENLYNQGVNFVQSKFSNSAPPADTPIVLPADYSPIRLPAEH